MKKETLNERKNIKEEIAELNARLDKIEADLSAFNHLVGEALSKFLTINEK